jgi:antitoxin component YwqK of YwqJK toxin-antitoxin module
VHVDDLRGERGYEEEGYFWNDKKDGIWRRYSLEGDLIALENYRYGVKDGKNVYFNYQGEPLREEYWRAIDPKNPYDTVPVFDLNDPSKIVRFEVVKVESANVKHGVWKYYDTYKGTVESTEEWVMGKLKQKPSEMDDLAPIDIAKGGTATGTTEKKEEKKTVTKPKEVLDFEKKNNGKKKIKVRDGSTGGL